MFRRHALIAVFIPLAVVIVANASPRALEIEVQRTSESPFTIRLTFQGETDGNTRIILPSEWGGQCNLTNAIHDLRTPTPDAAIADTNTTAVKNILHKPGSKVTLVYELLQDYSGSMANAVRYRPVTGSEFTHWIGNTVWVLPDWQDIQPIRVSLKWRNLPNQWTIANSFGARERTQRFETTMAKLRQAVCCGRLSACRNYRKWQPVDHGESRKMGV